MFQQFLRITKLQNSKLKTIPQKKAIIFPIKRITQKICLLRTAFIKIAWGGRWRAKCFVVTNGEMLIGETGLVVIFMCRKSGT